MVDTRWEVSPVAIIEDLREAKKLIGNRGWRRGPRVQAGTTDGPVDILEALSIVTHEYVNKAMWGPHYVAAKKALVAALPGMGERERNYPGETLIRFNDAPSRMVNEVTTLFDKAINMIQIPIIESEGGYD